MAFVRDLMFALRTLVKSPVFAATSIATLALGIGATTAIFSVVRGVLLEPLPYPNADRIVKVCHDLDARNVRDFPFAPGDFHDLRQQISLFDEAAGVFTQRFTVPGQAGGDPQTVRIAIVTPNVTRLLGARILYGRDFVEADSTPLPPPPPPPPAGGPAAPPPPPPPPQAAILSHEFWQRRYGGDPNVVGTDIDLGGPVWHIVGVAAPGLQLLFPPDENVEKSPDVWIATNVNFATGSRVNVFMRVFARMKPGVRLAEAQAQVDTLSKDLRKRFQIKETAGFHLRLEPMAADLVADVRPTILALMGAVIFVLLIACANVANLLLVRTNVRERELAVRSALGGTRRRLIQQMLTESLVISAAGAGVGLLLAMSGVRLLKAGGPENVPRLQDVAIDPYVLAFTAASAIGCALLFGLVPALRASRPDVQDVLRRGGRNAAAGSGKWLQRGVVIAEVSLSFVLLVASGLMIRSFVALQRADPGYNTNGLLTFQIEDRDQNSTPDGRRAFVAGLQARLRALQGVTAVTAASPFPLDGESALARYGTEAALADPSKFQQAAVPTVLPGYFEAMGTPLLSGRTFTEADNRLDARFVVIDERLARKMFTGERAVGRTLVARIRTPEPERFEVIGVVRHQRHTSLSADGREALFIPDAYNFFGAANRWGVRTTAADPTSLAPQVRSIVKELNPLCLVTEVQPMSFYVDRAQAPTKFALSLIGVFAGIAVLLAVVGLYGVLSSHVRQRRAEIGVRMAFGAEQTRVFRMMVTSGLQLGAIGIAIGLVMAVWLTGLMQGMLVDVRPTDPATFAAIAALFLLVTAVASGIPALRASRLDPTTALRDE